MMPGTVGVGHALVRLPAPENLDIRHRGYPASTRLIVTLAPE